MSGTAPWCESVGPSPGMARIRRSSRPLRGSGNTDTDSASTSHSEEEEIFTINEVIKRMSAPSSPASRGSTPEQGVKGPSSEWQAPTTSESRLLSSSPCSTQPPRYPHKGYGAISNPRAQEYASINNNDGNSESENDHNENDKSGESIQKLPFFMISLVLICLGISSKFHSTLVDQYVYQRYASEIIGNVTHTASDPCFRETEHNDTQRALVKQVQDMTSQTLLLWDLTLFGLGVPSCIMLGVLSRSIGRKLQLFIPTFGYTFKCAGLVFLVYFNPNLNWIYLPYVVEGITGNYVGILLGLFLYTADISGRNKSRTTAMILMEGVRGSTSAALNILVGHMIQHIGFKLPAWLSLAAATTALLMIFALPNRKPQDIQAGHGNIQEADPPNWKRRFSMFLFPAGTFDNRNVKKMFTCAFVATFLFLIAHLGMKKVQSLYLMNEPICWSSSMIGYFSFGGEISSNLFTIFIGPLLIRCLPGMTVGVLGLISVAGGCIFLGVATRGFELFFQPAVNIGERLPMGLIRGELSRLVGPEAQGTLFATIAVMESLAFALGTSFLYVYNKTMGYYKGIVALVGAGMFIISTCILISFQRTWLKHYRDSNDDGRKTVIAHPAENDGNSKRA